MRSKICQECGEIMLIENVKDEDCPYFMYMCQVCYNTENIKKGKIK